MTRRRTSVIGPGRAQAFTQDAAEPTAPGAAPDPQTLWRWSLAAARELCLSLDGDPATEAQRLTQAKRRWDIAHGRLSGNPEESAGRSEVKRIEPPGGLAFWRKRFDAKDVAWQLNETGALNYLGTVDEQKRFGLRDHVGWMRNLSTGSDGASSLQVIETLDAGPNLGTWREWAPCSEVQGFALPLFVQASFVAALARQLLIGLEKLTRFEAVHNDIKPNNLCLAMPQKRQPKRPLWHARIDLQHPSLRLIDFELAFVPDKVRLTQTHNNPWVSPFARACHAKAAVGGLHEQDRVAILSAIDWGADLWSLGHLLDGWWEDALAFLDAWLNAVRETFGDGSSIARRADQLIGEQADAWQPLKTLADTLKAHDRPLNEAGQTRLAPREPTHAHLRAQLESAFPLLTSGRNSVVDIHWIDPHAPLQAPPVGRWRAVLAANTRVLTSRLRQQLARWMASVGSAITRATDTLRRHRKRWLSSAAALGLAGTLWWTDAPNVAASALVTQSQHLATRWLRDWIGYGDERALWLVRAPLALLQVDGLAPIPRSGDAPPPSAAAVVALEPQSDLSDLAPLAALVDPNARASVQRDLRRLVAWSLAEPHHLIGRYRPDVEADLTRFRDHYEQLKAQGHWQQVEAGPPSKPNDGLQVDPVLASEALALLGAAMQEPLPYAYAIELLACWGNAEQRAALPSLLDALSDPSLGPKARHSYYTDSVQMARQRLSAAQNPCLLDLP